MKKSLLLLLCTLVISIPIFSQQSTQNKNNTIVGSWELKNIERNFVNSDEKNKDNYFFYDAYTNHSEVSFTNEGTIKLIRNSELKMYDYKLTEQELILTFYSTDKSKISSTYYSYSLSGNVFTIWRKDPMMSEKYTFIKK